ncbi:hypothetical protein MMC08_008946 [Hypocenomyce scalaris]|nr:hypothetical protein [Hypocenomyce scalaris]
MNRLLGRRVTNFIVHVARDGVAEIINFLALLGGSLGKVGLDIVLMCANEVGEVSEPYVSHRGGSSTMPQKRNPVSSELMLVCSKILRFNAGLVLEGMVADFECATGPWHLEWIAVPESFVVAAGGLAQARFALSGLSVYTQKMKENLQTTHGLIMAEAVMMELAPHLGRQNAHDMVYNACNDCIETNSGLYNCLRLNETVMSKLSEDQLKVLCDPSNYLGACTPMVEDVLAWKKI